MKAPITPFCLSVLLITYNHELFIDRALDGLFLQDQDGPIEVVVADDASTDKTLARIRARSTEDPRFFFRFLEPAVNLGITGNYRRSFASVSTPYVAVLEGDDWWTCPSKLSQQYRFLNEHRECDLCSTNYFVFEVERGQFRLRVPSGTGYRYIGAGDLVADNLVGNFSTCMYRREALARLPGALFEILSYDWIVNIYIALDAPIGFLEEPMSVYRVHSGGAWSKTSVIERLKAQRESIPAYDALTGGRVHEEFEALSLRLSHQISLEEISGITGVHRRSISRLASSVIAFTPPFLVALVRALVPPALVAFVRRR